MARTIIFVARHYPPEASGGARRPFLLVQALRKAGVRVIIISPFGDTDDTDHIRVSYRNAANLKATTKESVNVSSSPRDFVRTWLRWPDPDIVWARKVQTALLQQLIEADCIITTSPPESLALCGAYLAQKLKIPWFPEFRDTWITASHRVVLKNSRIRRMGERYIARKALRGASGFFAVSQAVANDIMDLTQAHTPYKIIGHFSTPPKSRADLPKESINLVHAGGFSLSDHRRHLSKLIESLKQIAKAHPNLHLHIAGQLTTKEADLLDATTEFETTWHGTVPLAQSQALQAGADGLLLCTPDNSHALPGKYAEYILTGRPIYYTGGGDWIHLANPDVPLLRLEDGIKAFGQSMTYASNSALTADAAALIVRDFITQNL